MDIYIQALLSIVVGLIVSYFTSWISVNRAISQFHSEKWWERKADAYSKIIEALFHVKHGLSIQYDALIEGVNTTSSMERNKAKVIESYEEIYKAEGIGAFIISEKAAKRLQQLRIELEKNSQKIEHSVVDFVENDLVSVKNCLDFIREEAKSDLRVKTWQEKIWLRFKRKDKSATA